MNTLYYMRYVAHRVNMHAQCWHLIYITWYDNATDDN